MTNRRAFLLQLTACAAWTPSLASAQPAAQPAGKGPLLRFATASDGHFGQADTDFERFHLEIVNWLNDEARAKGLDFVVFNGDLVHDQPTLLPELKKRYQRLTVPFFVNRGNHDKATPDFWKETWGYPENHAFERGDYGFILASTSNEKGEYVSPDTAWLARQLESFKAKKGIFPFLHIAQTKVTRHAIDRPEAFALLTKTPNVVAVFHGHDHDIDNVIYANGRAHFFDGHMGGNWGTNYRGYRIVEVQADGAIQTYQCNPQAFLVNSNRLGR